MTGNAPGTNAQDTYEFTNTNKWDTRQLVTMALMCAIGVLLSFVEFPLLPGVTWLKYDASAMPAMVCGFAFGPAAGLAVGVVGAVIHGILMADFSGAVMNILVVTGFILPAALVYRRSRTFKSGVIGLVLSAVAATVMAILGIPRHHADVAGVPPDAVGHDPEAPSSRRSTSSRPWHQRGAHAHRVQEHSNLITPKKKQVKGR